MEHYPPAFMATATTKQPNQEQGSELSRQDILHNHGFTTMPPPPQPSSPLPSEDDKEFESVFNDELLDGVCAESSQAESIVEEGEVEEEVAQPKTPTEPPITLTSSQQEDNTSVIKRKGMVLATRAKSRTGPKDATSSAQPKLSFGAKSQAGKTGISNPKSSWK